MAKLYNEITEPLKEFIEQQEETERKLKDLGSPAPSAM